MEDHSLYVQQDQRLTPNLLSQPGDDRMSGPMQMYLYVHDAILREVAYFEAAARELNRDSAEEVAEFADWM